jgi:aldehyde:ferredoxin oxidoreductase
VWGAHPISINDNLSIRKQVKFSHLHLKERIMPFAVMGKVLWVNLSDASITEEIIPEEIYQRFLSGIGLAAYLLYREIPPHEDALGPENVLGFVSGLLNGTNSLFTGRWMAVAKSPLTGAWGEANCGGTFAAAIKRCGYDGIFFKGISEKPVYLEICNGQAQLKDASHLWGKDAIETDEFFHAINPNTSTACIGGAGEKQSLLAGICNDSGRLAARSGLGAVMGGKLLKAVVLQGNRKINVKDKEAMQRLSQTAHYWTTMQVTMPPGKVTRFIGTLMRILPFQWAQDGLLYKWMLRQWGTVSMNQVSVEMGDSPIQNWRGSNHEFNLAHSDTSNPDRITRFEEKKYHCRSCALACGGIVSNQVVEEGHKPEYETVLAWGGLLLNEDLDSIFAINDRLNRAGMDSISAGGTVAFAIECSEKGLLTTEDLAGLDLGWGKSKAIQVLLEKMITREGIGDLLADGSKKAAERLNARAKVTSRVVQRNAEDFAVQAGGQELAMHDGRNDPGFSLHAVVEPMPGRHTNGSQLYYEMFQLWTRVPGLPKAKKLYLKTEKYRASVEQATAAVACSRFSQVMNAAGLCLFGAFIGVNRLPVFEWLNAATGWNLLPAEYMQTGARIQALKQLFNAREGISLRHTINPRAIGAPPLRSGANHGRTLDMDRMVRNYWSESGWDPENGMPLPETLITLEIKEMVQ